MNDCIFCQKPLSNGEDTVTLQQKGCDSILKASEDRGSDITVTLNQVVHARCRLHHFTNKRTIQFHLKQKQCVQPEQYLQQTLRSEESTFSYEYDCIFCGCPDAYKGKKSEHKLIPVRTMDFQNKILKACDEFKGEWDNTVRGRVTFVQIP